MSGPAGREPLPVSRVVVAGASGLIGSALVPALRRRGYEVRRLVRRPPAPEEPDAYRWDPQAGALDPTVLEGVDVVVHLGGANIASGRWSARRKREIRESRVGSTHLLARTIAAMDDPPRAWLCASAIGYYGDRGDELLDEGSPAGQGFLCEVCQAWEAACQPARDAGVRVVNMRIGVVLARSGGLLARLLPVFRLGLGGRVGSGQQYISWIAIDDVVSAVLFLADRSDIAGPVHVVAPHPVTNAEFTRTLARVLRRPAVLPVPGWVVELIAGEMGRRLALESTRVVPRVLERAGFRWQYAQLEPALRHLLSRR